MTQQVISAAEIQRMGGLAVYMRKAAEAPTVRTANPPALAKRSGKRGTVRDSLRDNVPAAAHAPRIPTEDAEQAAVIRWANATAGACPALDMLFHVPNGGSRHKATAARLKGQGVKPGVPDLFLPVPKDGFHGLWIELKRIKGGKVSPEQQVWHERLTARGYRVEVCGGAGEAIAVLKDYLGMRA